MPWYYTRQYLEVKLQAGKAGELYYKIFGNTALFDKGVCFLKLDYKEFSKITADFIEERQKKLDIGTRGKIKDNT